MSGVFLGIISISAFLIGMFIWSSRPLLRFTDRCLGLMSTSTFMTPCEISVAYMFRYGSLTDPWHDAALICLTFQSLEKRERVIGIEKQPNEDCQCRRAYCLKFGTRRKETSAKRPRLEWIPEGAVNPV